MSQVPDRKAASVRMHHTWDQARMGVVKVHHGAVRDHAKPEIDQPVRVGWVVTEFPRDDKLYGPLREVRSVAGRTKTISS